MAIRRDIRDEHPDRVKLYDAIDRYRRVWIFCRVCGRAEVEWPLILARRLGRTLTLSEAAAFMVCTGTDAQGRACKNRKAVVLLRADPDPGGPGPPPRRGPDAA